MAQDLAHDNTSATRVAEWRLQNKDFSTVQLVAWQRNDSIWFTFDRNYRGKDGKWVVAKTYRPEDVIAAAPLFAKAAEWLKKKGWNSTKRLPKNVEPINHPLTRVLNKLGVAI